MVRVISLVAVLLITNFGVAQNFRPGSVRLKGGQEQTGLIGNLVHGVPEGIQYKDSEGAEEKIYYAGEVEGYRIDGGIFYTAFQNPASSADWSFVELLVNGPMKLMKRNNLYFMVNKNGTKYHQLTKGSFKSVFKREMQNCLYVASKAFKVKLNNESLADHVRAYNDCISSKDPNMDGVPRNLTFSLLVGYDNTSASFTDDSHIVSRYLTTTALTDKAPIQIGGDLVYRTFSKSSLLGIYSGLFYNINKHQNTGRLVVGDQAEVNEYSLEYSEIKIPLGIELSPLTRSRISYNLRFGIVTPIVLGLKSTHVTQELEENNDKNIIYREPGNVTSLKKNVQLAFGFGMDYRISEKNRIKVQFSVSTGEGDAVVKLGPLEPVATGRFTSIGIMAGFVF